MANNSRISWIEHPEPWLLEQLALRRLTLPLNLDGNAHCAFSATLLRIREQHFASAAKMYRDAGL